MGCLDAAPDEKALDQLLSLGIKRWPHDPFVFDTVMQASQYVRPDWTMKMIEETAESLPSRNDVESFLHGIKFHDDAEDTSYYFVQEIELLAEKLRLDVSLFDDNKFSERIQAVNQTLTMKGWKPSSSEGR